MLLKRYLKEGPAEKTAKWLAFLKRPSTEQLLLVASILREAGKNEEALAEIEQAVKNANSVEEACRARIEKMRILIALNKTDLAAKEYEAIRDISGGPEWAVREAEGLLGREK